MLVEPEKAVFDVLQANENLLYANWGYIEDAVEPARSTCVVLAAYTTTQARLEIYNYIEKLTAARVLYMDTDSCIFKCDRNNPNEYHPVLGSLFGNMTDELKAYGAGTFITDFLSGEPKFYAFRAFVPSTAETVECCKVKRISLNSTNSHKINFDSVKRLIVAYFETNTTPIVLNCNAIRRTRTHEVITRGEKSPAL